MSGAQLFRVNWDLLDSYGSDERQREKHVSKANIMIRVTVTVTVFISLGLTPLAAEARKPSILFSCPGENRYEYVGFDYMRELAKQGFEVDFTENALELTWERVRKFDVLVVLDFPIERAGQHSLFAQRHRKLNEYFAVLKKFLAAGGGIFLHYSPHYGGTAPNHLLKEWGIQFPVMLLEDRHAKPMTKLTRGNLCSLTDRVLPSPVSKGVELVWYPIERHYTGAHTMPILIDESWQPVLKAGKTSYAAVPKYDPGGIQPVEGALIPQKPVNDPVLFAIRDIKKGGRLAAVQTWHQFSIGSGMKWQYNHEILSRGIDGRPSHYGKLLTNTYRWLAAEGFETDALGGHVTDPNRLLEPQLRPGALERLAEWVHKEEEVLEYRRPPMRGKLFRGLFGAQTKISGAAGSVSDYAGAAAEAGLDFLVFLEDLRELDPEKLQALKAEVKKHTTDKLQLFAGYRMESNIGNHLFVYGKNPPFPEDRVLVGKDKRTYNLQYQDKDGNWAKGNPSLDWGLYATLRNGNNLGYFKFSQSGNGMKMYDVRPFSAAAILTYEKGKLIDDALEDYLTTNDCQAVASPISMNLVRSPSELKQAVAANQALTYAQARSLKTVYRDALRWNNSYDGLNVFPSNGPIIHRWPHCKRTIVFGSERFVTGRSLTPSPIHVTSEAGLKEIRIYDGKELFRRFVLNGEREFNKVLFLSGAVQRTMALIAEDLKGGRAVSFANRSYKEGTYISVFCSDHVNDCGNMIMAHGPHWPYLFPWIPVANAGRTWDGGPKGNNLMCNGQFTQPRLRSDKGRFGQNPYQYPILEFGDEGATRARMVCNRQLEPGVPSINPWYTFGPLRPSELIDMWASHTFWIPYTVGVEPSGWGGPGVFGGAFPSLFTEEITFKQDQKIERLLLWHSGWTPLVKGQPILLVIGGRGGIRNVMDASVRPVKSRRFKLDTGDWFGLFSSRPSNTQLFINRGEAVTFTVGQARAYWLAVTANMEKRTVRKGDRYGAEFFTMTWPLDMSMTDASQLAETVEYLKEPTGLKLARGKRLPSPGGLLEVETVNGAAELSIPRPENLQVNVPLRISGLNRRWSIGLYQYDGYRTHYYSKENSGYRALGADHDGRAYIPLYVSRSKATHILAGHPIVADEPGKDLFIQVTRINDGLNGRPPGWHLSVNNPLDRPVTSTLRRTMDLDGLRFTELKVTLKPGEYLVLPNQ